MRFGRQENSFAMVRDDIDQMNSETLRQHPEWRTDSLLSEKNEFQRQRPERFDDAQVQLGVRFIDGSYE